VAPGGRARQHAVDLSGVQGHHIHADRVEQRAEGLRKRMLLHRHVEVNYVPVGISSLHSQPSETPGRDGAAVTMDRSGDGPFAGRLRRSLIAPLYPKDSYSPGWVVGFGLFHLVLWIGAGAIGVTLVIRIAVDGLNKPFDGFFWGSYVTAWIAAVAAIVSLVSGLEGETGQLINRVLVGLAPIISAVVSGGAFGMVATTMKFDNPQAGTNLTAVTADNYDDTDWALTLVFAILASGASGALLYAATELNKQMDEDGNASLPLAVPVVLVNISVFVGLYWAKVEHENLPSKAKQVAMVAAISATAALIILFFVKAAEITGNCLGYFHNMSNDYWVLFTVRSLMKVVSSFAMITLVGTFEDIDIAPYSVYGLFFAMAAGSGMLKVERGDEKAAASPESTKLNLAFSMGPKP